MTFASGAGPYSKYDLWPDIDHSMHFEEVGAGITVDAYVTYKFGYGAGAGLTEDLFNIAFKANFEILDLQPYR